MATLDDIKHDKPIEFHPYINDGLMSTPLSNYKRVVFDSDMSLSFISFLKSTGNELVVEETLQGVCTKKDGTPLKSAFPSLQSLRTVYLNLCEQGFNYLLMPSLESWANLGANEVQINFESL